MEWFSNWWGSLDLALQILYCIALPSSLLLILKSLMIIIGVGEGGDSDGGFDLDSDCGAGYPSELTAANLFTLQGVASFLAVFGWTSILMYQAGAPLIVSIAAAIVLGLAVMFALAKVMMSLTKLAHTGTLDVKTLLGGTGTVYLNIPPKGEGTGKVTIQTSERLVEFEAVSESDEDIPNNAAIRVIDILGENVLVVEKL